MLILDTTFDFTTDTPKYWDKYWEFDSLLGSINNDPDSASKMMQNYQKILWSKTLPNGEIMELKIGSGSRYLTWKNFRFGSDSITTSFRYVRYRFMIEQVAEYLSDYHQFMETYIHKTYTIGGAIIFPKQHGGINQMRGWNYKIKDRWDLTLECIRRYYQKEENPLYSVLLKNKDFFDLFVDFKGYVDFFCLQDCVTEDYKVDFWLKHEGFESNPLPDTVDKYLLWMKKQIEFVEKRNKRIDNEIINRKELL